MKKFEDILRIQDIPYRKEIFISNFIGGLGWSLGAMIGPTVIVTVTGFLLNHFGALDIIKNLIAGKLTNG